MGLFILLKLFFLWISTIIKFLKSIDLSINANYGKLFLEKCLFVAHMKSKSVHIGYILLTKYNI